jgi:hypothetical protein
VNELGAEIVPLVDASRVDPAPTVNTSGAHVVPFAHCEAYAGAAASDRSRPLVSHNAAPEMTTDIEGYGARPGQTAVDRLLEDCRTLSPSGIERVADGWERRGSDEEFVEAERAALQAIERAGRSEPWEGLRNQLLGLTESGTPLVAWREEHGHVGHQAEDALLASAMALTAGDDLDRHHREVLLRPMANALPWLLAE